MNIALALLGTGIVTLYAVLWILGPIVLTDWLRHRREDVRRRQIALTDAIHGQLGPVVSPEVRKALWGPWQIHMALPFTQPAEVGRILTAVDGILSATGETDQYQIVLTSRNSITTPWWSSRHSLKQWSRGAASA